VQRLSWGRLKGISVEKQTTWLVFSSGFDVAKANENPAPVGMFSPATV